MKIESFIEKLREFLKGSKTYVGVTFKGMYDMPEDIFFHALRHYLETKQNTLDEYSRMKWLGWGDNLRHEPPDEMCPYHTSELETVEKYLRRESFWNIYEILPPEQIHEIKKSFKKSRAYYQKKKFYKKRRKEASIYTSNAELREKIFNRDGRLCHECGKKIYLQLDHIIPVSKGGKDHELNMQVLCRSCNAKKGDR